MLKYPIRVLFPVLFLGCLMLSVYLKIHPEIGLITGFILGGALSLLYSAYMTTKWRIWAFSNVDNVHELKRAAITEQLINEDDSWQTKLEIRTQSDNEALAAIQKRFEEERSFIDDLTVPNVTLIFNSYIEYTLGGWFLIGLGVATGFLISWFTLLILIPAIGILYKGYTRTRQDTGNAVITITNDGIGTYSADFHNWSEIENEKVTYISSGRNGSYQFGYDYPGGSEDINLNFVKIKPSQLNHLLYIYRNRNMQKQNAKATTIAEC